VIVASRCLLWPDSRGRSGKGRCACNSNKEGELIVTSLARYQALFGPEEEARQRVAEELLQSHAELQAFAYTAAHDLREPLRTISTCTQLLVQKAELDEADREIAHFIVDGVRRLSALVDSLLSSAVHGFNGSHHEVHLGRAAAHAIANLRETINSSRATITLGTLPTVDGAECDLIRLFQNLIGNAIRYRSDVPVTIDITAECAGPEWVIRVRDNGIGIPRNQYRRIFGIFSSRVGGRAGTGIGLAVCKKIVEGLGGMIWVESEVGLGSTFCFTLAVRAQASGSSENTGTQS